MRLDHIPRAEYENVISMYWQLMRESESNAHETNSPLDKHTVEGAYRLWNRVTGDNKKPVWLQHADEKR